MSWFQTVERSDTFCAVYGIHTSTLFSELSVCLKNIGLTQFSKAKYFSDKQIRVTFVAVAVHRICLEEGSLLH